MTIFGKILRGEIPADFVYQDDQVVAFRDINPQAPTHIVIIPRKPIVSVDHAGPEDAGVLGQLLLVAAKVAKDLGLSPEGYRLVTNVGRDGGQSVFHLHVHLLGGRALGWPPG